MANDSITPRTAISRFIDADPDNLDETVRITRQRARGDSFEHSRNAGSRKSSHAKQDAKKATSGRKLSMSKKELTPKSTILGFIGSQDSEQTVRVQQRIPNSPRSPLSPSRSSRRKSRQGNLLRQATQRSLRKNRTGGAEKPTPRTVISSILSEGVDETPVVPVRHRQVEDIGDESDGSTPGKRLRSFQEASLNESEDGSYMNSYTDFSQPSQSSKSDRRRIRIRPSGSAFPYEAVFEGNRTDSSQVHVDSHLESISEDGDTEGRSNQARGRVIGSVRVAELKTWSSEQSPESLSGLKAIKQEQDEAQEDIVADRIMREDEYRNKEMGNEYEETLEELGHHVDNISRTVHTGFVEIDEMEVEEQAIAEIAEEEEERQGNIGEEGDNDVEQENVDEGNNELERVQEEALDINNTSNARSFAKDRNTRTKDRHWTEALSDLTTTPVVKGLIESNEDVTDGIDVPTVSGHDSVRLTTDQLIVGDVRAIPESEDEADTNEGLPGFNNTFSRSEIRKSKLVQSTLDSFAKIRTPVLPRPSPRLQAPTPDVPALQRTPLATTRILSKSNAKQQRPEPSKRSAEKVNKSSVKSKKSKDPRVRLPRVNTASIFRHFVDGRVSNEVISEVEKVADDFWRHVASDLDAYAAHAKRNTIEASDIELLMTRQRLVNERHTMVGYAEKYLPLDYQREIIQVATSGNVLVPK